MLNRRKIPLAPRDGPVSEFQRELVALMPFLRASSLGLCGGRAIADDMAQDALFRAWRAQGSFEAGSNMKAWLYTILRNCIASQTRRSWRQSPWNETLALQIAAPPLEQEWAMQLSDVARAMSALPDAQREALLFVAAAGFTHKDAAEALGAVEGTIKSRVARARVAVLDLVDGGGVLPPRPVQRAADARNGILAELSAISSLPLSGAGACDFAIGI